MFILSFISSDLKFWSVNHTSTNQNSELKVSKNIKFLSEISNNWPNVLLCMQDSWIMLIIIVDNIAMH